MTHSDRLNYTSFQDLHISDSPATIYDKVYSRTIAHRKDKHRCIDPLNNDANTSLLLRSCLLQCVIEQNLPSLKESESGRLINVPHHKLQASMTRILKNNIRLGEMRGILNTFIDNDCIQHPRQSLHILIAKILDETTSLRQLHNTLELFKQNKFLMIQELTHALKGHQYPLYRHELQDIFNSLSTLACELSKTEKCPFNQQAVEKFTKAVYEDINRVKILLSNEPNPQYIQQTIKRIVTKQSKRHFPHRNKYLRLFLGVFMTTLTLGLSILFRKTVFGCRSALPHMARTKTRKNTENILFFKRFNPPRKTTCHGNQPKTATIQRCQTTYAIQ